MGTRYTCRNCKQELESSAPAGTAEMCPLCRMTNRAPAPGDLSDLPTQRPLPRRKMPAVRRHGRWMLLGWVAAGCLALGGMVVAIASTSVQSQIYGWWAIGTGIGLAVSFLPGTIAAARRLPNATGLFWLGFLGMFVGILWIIALVLALVTAPPPNRAWARSYG